MEPQLRVGSDALGDEYTFHQIAGSRSISGGRIVVADYGSLELRLFDHNGRFISRFGRRGKGPGEFTSLTLLPAAARDTVFLYDVLQRRLTSYSVNTGEYLITGIAARGSGKGVTECCLVLADHTIMFQRTAGPNSTPVTYLVQRLRAEGVDTIGQYQGPQTYVTLDLGDLPTVLTLPFTASSTAVAAGQRVYLYDGTSSDIRVYSQETSLTGLMRIAGAAREVSRRQHETYVTQHAKQATEPKYEPLLRRVYGSLDVPQLAAMFRKLIVDESGMLWALTLNEDMEAPPVWMVFDATGRAIGTVTLPQSLEVHFIGTDHVLGRCRDENDLEYVCRHRLARNTSRLQ